MSTSENFYGNSFEKHMDLSIELLQRYVRCESITGNERRFAELLAHDLTIAGLEVQLREVATGRPNVYAVLHGTSDGPTLMIMGHMDTVNVTGWHERWPSGPLSDPFSGYYDEHYLYGRGSADQKGGIASAVAAVKALRDADVRLAGTVVLAFLVDEESGEKDTGVSAGAKALVDDILSGTVPRPNFAIYTEPTALKVYTSQMGFIVGEVTVVGKTSYFGTPWLGKDAIRDAVLLLDALYKHSDEISSRTHDKLGNAFLLVTEIQGGGYIAVPGKCVINFIRKVLPSESLQSAALAIESLLADLIINILFP